MKTYTTFRFLDYKVYQEAKKIFIELENMKEIFEKSSLYPALVNTSTSIVLHVAEASALLPKQAKKELQKAILATHKTVAILDIYTDLQELTPEEFNNFSELYKGIIFQLKCFIKALPVKS